MGKAWQVAKREFWVAVRKKSYIILTFGMPFFMLLYIGVVSIPGIIIHKKEKAKRVVGIVDNAGVIHFELTEKARSASIEGKEIAEKMLEDAIGKGAQIESQKSLLQGFLNEVEPIRFADEKEAEEALKHEKIFMYYVIPEDYLEKGKVLSYTRAGSIFSSKGKSGFMRKLLVMSLLYDRIEPVIQERVNNPLDLDEYALEEGKFVKKDILREIGSLGIPLALCIILFMSMMMSSGFLLQGVAEEKENRVIEIILSSITPDELLLGKIIGSGGAGLLQLFVWLGIGSLPIIIYFTTIELRLSTIILAIPYYLLGFLLFASLMAGMGSLGSNLKESQQLTMMWTLPSVLPLVFFSAILDEPNGIIARVFSYIPITSPTSMIIRIATGKTPFWEIGLTILILATSIYFAVKIFGKVFRIGVLMYGKRPSFRSIIKAARQA